MNLPMDKLFSKVELNQYEWHTILLALRNESKRLEAIGYAASAEHCAKLHEKLYPAYENAEPKRMKKPV